MHPTTEEAVPESDPQWLEMLTLGHGWPRIVRTIFQHMPSAPRCKVCVSPFGGVGGKVFGLMGFRPSRKNPNLCGRCLDELPPGGALVDVAVLFADLRGSTGMGEQLDATTFAKRLNRFYAVATEVLIDHDAVIDKLIGDEVMALFIPGIAGPDYRRKACEAGLALLKAVGAEGGREPWLPLGVAAHAGPAFCGNVGAQGIVDFTALGDTINTASRLQGLAAAGELVLSDELYASVSPPDPEPERRVVAIRGRAEPMAVRTLRA
ncbi:MAG: adenylate/guanylate cyclase domain-containing protein [Tepidiformaceae bacterium]